MITIHNKQRWMQVDIKKISCMMQKMLEVAGYADFDVALLICGDTKMRQYNREYRKKDQATDVLSFPFHQIIPGKKLLLDEADQKDLGDIIISPRSVAKKAVFFDRTLEEHFIVLLAHGVAHLVGYDHENEVDFKKMDRFEKKLLKAALV
jgi:probable rRNA maturation factor